MVGALRFDKLQVPPSTLGKIIEWVAKLCLESGGIDRKLAGWPHHCSKIRTHECDMQLVNFCKYMHRIHAARCYNLLIIQWLSRKQLCTEFDASSFTTIEFATAYDVFAENNADAIRQAFSGSPHTNARRSRAQVCFLAIISTVSVTFVNLHNLQSPIAGCCNSHKAL